MNIIACPQCGFENDTTRVFCQNCGARIAAETPAGKLFIPPQQQAPAGGRKPIKPVSVASGPSQQVGIGRLLRSIISTAVIAAVLAAVIQMIRTPDGIPRPQPVNDNAATLLFMSMKTLNESTTPTRTWQATQDQINNYLAARIIALPDDGGIRSRFARAFVTLGDGQYSFYIEQQVLKWPIYVYVTKQPSVVDGIMTVKPIGGGVGRLPVDPRLVPLLERMITPVEGAITEATDLLQKASAVTITPRQVSVSWGGSKPVAP